MRVQLAQQVQELLGTSDPVLSTERGDDVAWLIGHMVNRGVVEVLDRHIPRHGKPRGRSWGWTAVLWLAYSLKEGDHRKVAVAADSTGMNTTLSHLSAQVIDPLDCRDDRRGHRLQHVSPPQDWQGIEADVKAPSLAVYPWPQAVIRGEATTVAGEHDVRAGGRWPCGHRQADPSRPQINVLTGSLEPLGGRWRPMCSRVHAPMRADTYRASSGSRRDSTRRVGWVSAMVSCVRGPPAPLWRSATTCTSRRSPDQARRLRRC